MSLFAISATVTNLTWIMVFMDNVQRHTCCFRAIFQTNWCEPIAMLNFLFQLFRTCAFFWGRPKFIMSSFNSIPSYFNQSCLLPHQMGTLLTYCLSIWTLCLLNPFPIAFLRPHFKAIVNSFMPITVKGHPKRTSLHLTWRLLSLSSVLILWDILCCIWLTRLCLDVQVNWHCIISSKWNHIFKNHLHFPKLRWW